MIVDCHTHVFEVPGHVSDEFVAEANARSRGKPLDLHTPPERHWPAMAGVDRAIVFGIRALHSGLTSSNDYVAAYVAKHPEKLIAFAAVDPAHDDVHDTLDHAIGDLKMRGVKLGPIYQNLHPLDERMMPVYAYCERHALPILIHQATTFPRRAPLKYARPMDLEEVAMAFPDLKMVLAHMGHPWIDETIALVRKQPNFYADISALHYRPHQFYNALISAKEYAAFDKLLFGSDYPFTTAEATIESLRTINEMAASPRAHVPMELIEGLIHSPTLSLLGLD